MKRTTQVVVTSLVFIKLIICAVFLFQVELGSIFWTSDAIASEPVVKTDTRSLYETDNSDDENVDIDFIIQKMNKLKEKEKQLQKRSDELVAFQAELDQKIEALTKIRNEIKSQMARKEGIEQQKIKHLIKAYAAMKPQSAAGLIERLEKPFAIQLLSNMKGEAVGKILTYVEKEKAADLIEGLASRK
jgi:flagellar motility protein MotE (MotC chaperone)